jgi:hypothetical protein
MRQEDFPYFDCCVFITGSPIFKVPSWLWSYGSWIYNYMFNATYINISVISRCSVLLVEETGVPGENHKLAAGHWQTLSHKVVSSKSRHDRIINTYGIVLQMALNAYSYYGFHDYIIIK